LNEFRTDETSSVDHKKFKLMKEVTLGIDIGGTFTKFGFIERSGKAIFDSSVTTTGHKTITAYQKALADEIKSSFTNKFFLNSFELKVLISPLLVIILYSS